ncbi:hypothetical protein STEG23_028121 [Scotinomys teguina]
MYRQLDPNNSPLDEANIRLFSYVNQSTSCFLQSYQMYLHPKQGAAALLNLSLDEESLDKLIHLHLKELTGLIMVSDFVGLLFTCLFSNDKEQERLWMWKRAKPLLSRIPISQGLTRKIHEMYQDFCNTGIERKSSGFKFTVWIFPHSVDWRFVLVIVSFALQKLLSFM